MESAQAVDEGRVAVLRATARGLLGEDAVDVRAGLCFRPTGGPVVGEVREEMGGMRVWVASGHGPWGVSFLLFSGSL